MTVHKKIGDYDFEWDSAKAEANLKKHKVSFEDAASAFTDPNATWDPDPEHSDDEERFKLVGLSFNFELLLVCHCLRHNDSVYRIISAREAGDEDAKRYHQTRLEVKS